MAAELNDQLVRGKGLNNQLCKRYKTDASCRVEMVMHFVDTVKRPSKRYLFIDIKKFE